MKPKNDMIWADLIHLSYNMWSDHGGDDDTPHTVGKPYLRFDETLWNDLLPHMQTRGVNMVVLDLGDAIRYDSHPELAVDNAWSPEKLREELKKMRAMGIEPIPKLNFSTSHDYWMGEYARMVSTSRYYEVCRDLIREVSELFDTPRFFHIGMDEEACINQGHYEYAVVRNGDLWWRDLFFFIDEVEKNGMRSWMWSDYLWHHNELFFQKMPKSVLQSNWYYGDVFGDFSPADGPLGQTLVDETYLRAYLQLAEKGYDQIPTGSNWGNDVNMEGTVEYLSKHMDTSQLLGFMTAPWFITLEETRAKHFAAVDQLGRARAARK